VGLGGVRADTPRRGLARAEGPGPTGKAAADRNRDATAGAVHDHAEVGRAVIAQQRHRCFAPGDVGDSYGEVVAGPADSAVAVGPRPTTFGEDHTEGGAIVADGQVQGPTVSGAGFDPRGREARVADQAFEGGHRGGALGEGSGGEGGEEESGEDVFH